MSYEAVAGSILRPGGVTDPITANSKSLDRFFTISVHVFCLPVETVQIQILMCSRDPSRRVARVHLPPGSLVRQKNLTIFMGLAKASVESYLNALSASYSWGRSRHHGQLDWRGADGDPTASMGSDRLGYHKVVCSSSKSVNKNREQKSLKSGLMICY